MNYTSGSGSSTLIFNYTIASGQTSADLDYVATSSLALNNGTIKDPAGNSATLTLASPGASGSLGANKSIIIDTATPTVVSVNSDKSNGIYNVEDIIGITVNFSEAVVVTGTPQLTLETGTNDAVVNYASGSGSNALLFYYTVASGHNSADLDYASTSALGLNGGSINDAAGNTSNLTLAAPGQTNSLGANKAIIIDTFSPTISAVTSTSSNGTYNIGDEINISITFSEVVNVVGSPQLTLETGTSDAVVNYSSGSGGAVLTFTYTVAEGHVSSDLDYIGTSALALNNGTIKDLSGNSAVLTLSSPGSSGSLGANAAIIIDGVVPVVSSVSTTTSNNSYKIGDAIAINVVFSEVVNVSGTPQLTLRRGLRCSS